MYASIVGFLSDNSSTVAISWDETDARRAANFLVGLTDQEAINLLATLAAKGKLDKDDVVQVPRLKNRIFSNLAGLELIELKDSDFSVGGLKNLRDWLVKKKKLMYEDLRATKLRPPRGVLLVGVPGCGKSLSAKAIASQWELPLYRLDLSTIMGQYVGQSEGRLRDALETADRVAPCVLWIDEIEKGLSGQNDGTGVTRRLIGQFLFWLQESTARVFVVATANDVSTLPPELLRKGRFDELFFVDLPDAVDRADIIRMYYWRFLSEEPTQELVDELVAVSDGFAGADIEAALHEVGAAAYLQGGVESLEPGFIKANFTNTMPLSRTNPEQIEEIRAWGRERAVPAGTTSAPLPPAIAGKGRRVVLTGD
jgi:SpoVK/Ycf46/Vps4 family AAA+-type ATPase